MFPEIKNTEHNPERLLNQVVEGLCDRIAAKMASHTLRLLLRRRLGIKVLHFAYGKVGKAIVRSPLFNSHQT